MQRVRLNALILREVKVPMASGDRGSGRSSLKAKQQRARSVEAARDRGEPDLVAEPKGRTGSGTFRIGREVAGQER